MKKFYLEKFVECESLFSESFVGVESLRVRSFVRGSASDFREVCDEKLLLRRTLKSFEQR